MIMGFVQLVIVAAVLGLRNLFYRGPGRRRQGMSADRRVVRSRVARAAARR